MSGLLGRIFGKRDSGGGSDGPTADSTTYKDFEIHPNPSKEGGSWRTGGTITKETEDGTKRHVFVRADTHTSREDAISFSVTKAKQIIDEQGDAIFRPS